MGMLVDGGTLVLVIRWHIQKQDTQKEESKMVRIGAKQRKADRTGRQGFVSLSEWLANLRRYMAWNQAKVLVQYAVLLQYGYIKHYLSCTLDFMRYVNCACCC